MLLHKSNSTPKRVLLPYSQVVFDYRAPRSAANPVFPPISCDISLLCSLHHSNSSHISDCPLISPCTATEDSPESRRRRFAHLTERCRISVRDLLMLLDILISSFSSESVYWASWSRLRNQSARLAFSSVCTVYGKTRPRGQPCTRVKGCRQTLPKALTPNCHTSFPCQPASWRMNRGPSYTGTALPR